MARILYIDIETSPNIADVWGLWDQNVSLAQLRQSSRIIGFGYRWNDGKKAKWVSEYNRKTGELSENKAMLEHAYRLYEEADIVVTYNGDSFDHKHLNAAWAKIGLTPPAPSQSIDLFKAVKKNFKFPSNKLAYVADVLIGDTKVQNGGHTLWRQCLDPYVDANTRRRAWATMSRYCRQDVDLLVPLHEKLLPWLPASVNVSVMEGPQTVPVCGKCNSKNLNRGGFAYTSTRAYQRYVCKDCGAWSKGISKEWGIVK